MPELHHNEQRSFRHEQMSRSEERTLLFPNMERKHFWPGDTRSLTAAWRALPASRECRTGHCYFA